MYGFSCTELQWRCQTPAPGCFEIKNVLLDYFWPFVDIQDFFTGSADVKKRLQAGVARSRWGVPDSVSSVSKVQNVVFCNARVTKIKIISQCLYCRDKPI